jgi:hypothetical protein
MHTEFVKDALADLSAAITSNSRTIDKKTFALSVKDKPYSYILFDWFNEKFADADISEKFISGKYQKPLSKYIESHLK